VTTVTTTTITKTDKKHCYVQWDRRKIFFCCIGCCCWFLGVTATAVSFSLSLARASERESASHRNISKQKIQQRLFLLASVQIHALHSKDAKIPGSMKPVRSCSTTIPLDKKKIVRYEATSNLTVKINYSWCKSTELVSVLIT
jgi:hypothetical protein